MKKSVKNQEKIDEIIIKTICDICEICEIMGEKVSEKIGERIVAKLVKN